jgi:ATP/maltotriose-dependent transcriptional regulator MalT
MGDDAGWGQVGSVYGLLAEAVVRTGAPDVDAVLAEAQERLDWLGHERARPALLRARGLLLHRRGDLSKAVAALKISARIARSQRAALQRGRTLTVLADVARQSGEATLARAADDERAALVERIGPEVRGLALASVSGRDPA